MVYSGYRLDWVFFNDNDEGVLAVHDNKCLFYITQNSQITLNNNNNNNNYNADMIRITN